MTRNGQYTASLVSPCFLIRLKTVDNSPAAAPAPPCADSSRVATASRRWISEDNSCAAMASASASRAILCLRKRDVRKIESNRVCKKWAKSSSLDCGGGGSGCRRRRRWVCGGRGILFLLLGDGLAQLVNCKKDRRNKSIKNMGGNQLFQLSGTAPLS